MGHISVTYI